MTTATLDTATRSPTGKQPDWRPRASVSDGPAAHAVRIPSVRDATDLIASVLIALETGDAATFDLQARAERSLHQAEYRPTIRLVMDGWCWFLTPEQAHLVALALRLDVEIVGRDHLSPSQRDTLTDLVADAFEAAIRDADALAAARNAAGDVGPVPLFAPSLASTSVAGHA